MFVVKRQFIHLHLATVVVLLLSLNVLSVMLNMAIQLRLFSMTPTLILLNHDKDNIVLLNTCVTWNVEDGHLITLAFYQILFLFSFMNNQNYNLVFITNCTMLTLEQSFE